MGEVPVMEGEKGVWSRRQASVMRYKEKRQSRLFSKKIRYEVRKLNADKRPRIKVILNFVHFLIVRLFEQSARTELAAYSEI